MNYKRLSDCADFRKERSNNITLENYISTENMIENKGGVTVIGAVPLINTTSAYKAKDILFSNIRPYFKKIWFATRDGSCSNDVLVIKAKQNVNPLFLYYVLADNNFFNYATVTAKGTKMPRGTPKAIMQYLVPDISINSQTKIASILSAYDELIENNNKRIKLLEQMAENLYKEWFVRFRFPGYENAEYIEKYPSGWKVYGKGNNMVPAVFRYGFLHEIGRFIRGKNITSLEMKEGTIPVISAGIEPSGYHEVSNVKGVSLTISASGANAGYLKYNLNDIWAADCSYYQNDDNIWFVYNTLKFLQPVIMNMQCGAAQPHVYPKDINKLSILLPTKEVMLQFNKKVNCIYEEIAIIKKQNINLIKQRDLLLPRLMSGKLEVEHAE